jgi:uncharacterized YkwD family protein
MTSYRVVYGDNIWKIALKHNIGVGELLDANQYIKNPDSLAIGQIINIPAINNNIVTTTNNKNRELETEVVRLVNVERSKVGIPSLKENGELSLIARDKSQDFINKNYFAHNSPTYGTPFEMLRTYGIKFTEAGENIAKGQKSAVEVMDSWMNSPGHRENILNPNFNKLGVGVVEDNKGVLYWTQIFIKD